MPFTPPFYPIVFLRGFAAGDKDVRDAVNQVFQGFEIGSTRRRQDTGAAARSPAFFESVVGRMMADHDYEMNFRDGDYGYNRDKKVSQQSIWVHRYYDAADGEFGSGKKPAMEQYAIGLRETILRIRDKLCGDDAALRKAFKVHLVAHSMGGLVARCYLQNICRLGTGDAKIDKRLELKAAGVDPLVDRFFTYGTPHNGIEFRNINVPNLSGEMAFLEAGVFNRTRMREYLKPAKADPVNSLSGAFPANRTFCLIGTAYRDYDIEISKLASGGPGDGLVMCENAYTLGSPRAFVRRAHGGPYGIVNSEEGYQNLRRFLFGDWRADLSLEITEARLPDAVVKALKPGDKVEGDYLLDVIVGIRGEQVPLHERRVSTESAVIFPQTFTYKDKNPILKPKGEDASYSRIASLFLMSKASAVTPPGVSGPMVFFARLAMEAPEMRYKGEGWGPFNDKTLTGFKVLNDTFQVELDGQKFLADPAGDALRYGVNSVDGQATPHTLALKAQADGSFAGEIPFGPAPGVALKSGEVRGKLVISICHCPHG